MFQILSLLVLMDPSMGEFVANALKTLNHGNANCTGTKNLCLNSIFLTSSLSGQNK